MNESKVSVLKHKEKHKILIICKNRITFFSLLINPIVPRNKNRKWNSEKIEKRERKH